MGWSWAPFGASLAAHGVAVATAIGHPSAVAAAQDSPATVVLELAPDRVPSDRPGPQPAEARAPVAHGHTHPYPVPASHDWTPHEPSLVHVLPSAPSAPPSQTVVTSDPAPAPALPSFTIAIGPVTSASAGPASPTAAAGASAEGSAVESEQTVTVHARLLRGASPRYPGEARAQGLEALVPLEVIVSAAGVVESARVTGRASHAFEAAALEAIQQYRFVPAQRDGHAVRVRMRWTMEFRLR